MNYVEFILRNQSFKACTTKHMQIEMGMSAVAQDHYILCQVMSKMGRPQWKNAEINC